MTFSSKPRKRNVHHSWLMQTYYAARQAYLEQMEYETCMYPAEVREYKERNPQPLFKDFLIAQRYNR